MTQFKRITAFFRDIILLSCSCFKLKFFFFYHPAAPFHLRRYLVSTTIQKEELAKEEEAGRSGRGGMVLMGPERISQQLRFLVVYIFSAQDLPGFSSVGVPYVNALVQVSCVTIGILTAQGYESRD